jgi:exodeoxyribonuclease VII small subunit
LTDTTEPSYETATARIEEIIRRLDSGEAGLRETLDLCSEGRELVEYCTTELEAVGRGLQELRLEELVERLERGQARSTATGGDGAASRSGAGPGTAGSAA